MYYFFAKYESVATQTANNVLKKFHISSVCQNFPLSLALVM